MPTRQQSSNSTFWDAMIKILTFDVWLTIINKAAEQAMNGDNNARKFLTETLLRYGPSEPADLNTFWKTIIENARKDDANQD